MSTPPTATTLAALIALAVITGLSFAIAHAMVRVWLRMPRGRHRSPAPCAQLAATAVLPRDPFPAVDPDLTPRYASLHQQPTAVLAVPSDPWAEREDADALLIASAHNR